DDGEVRQYKGTYSQYVSARAKDEDRLRRIAARQHAEIGRLSTLADRMRHSSARRARQAKSLDKRVERLAPEAVTPIRTAPPCRRTAVATPSRSRASRRRSGTAPSGRSLRSHCAAASAYSSSVSTAPAKQPSCAFSPA